MCRGMGQLAREARACAGWMGVWVALPRGGVYSVGSVLPDGEFVDLAKGRHKKNISPSVKPTPEPSEGSI